MLHRGIFFDTIPTMNSKTLEEYQSVIKDYVTSFNFNWSNYVQYIHLVEEVAELGEALTVHEGDRQAGSGEKAQADHSNVKEEIGDILFTTIQIANQLNLDASKILESTFERYNKKLANLQK